MRDLTLSIAFKELVKFDGKRPLYRSFILLIWEILYEFLPSTNIVGSMLIWIVRKIFSRVSLAKWSKTSINSSIVFGDALYYKDRIELMKPKSKTFKTKLNRDHESKVPYRHCTYINFFLWLMENFNLIA